MWLNSCASSTEGDFIKDAIKKSQVSQVLEVSQMWIYQIFDFSGYQKLPALAASDRRSVKKMLLREVNTVLVDKKYKSYINCSGKDYYVTVLYFVSG